jgi:FKBP-type peptidyl-prolyl cis-trans isomerase 2
LLEKYAKDLKVVIKHFPLPSHRFAQRAATGALAADRQGKFWEFHHKLFESVSSLNEGKMQDIARELGLDMERFNKDLSDPDIQGLIKRDLAEGMKAEVGGTPAIFVNGKSLKNRSIEGFEQMIDQEVKKAETSKPTQSGGASNTGTVIPAEASGVAGREQVTSQQPDAVADTGKAGFVAPGQSADIHYLCRLSTGEVVAATETVGEDVPKSKIFVAKKEAGPLLITAVRPDESLPERPWPGPFEEEIGDRLARNVSGMKEGEKRQVELTARMIKPLDEHSGFVRLSKVRTRPKVMKMSRTEYEMRARKAPELGQPFTIDPAFEGQVESVGEEEVVIRLSAISGGVAETPFGQGRIREEGENYKVDIDAKEGSLVRIGNTIGRIINVTAKVITIDNRHPFGYEMLICDVTIEGIKKAEVQKEDVKGM